jgi:hypothetical protein
MHARAGRALGVLAVQAVRQADIDGIDVVAGEAGLVLVV